MNTVAFLFMLPLAIGYTANYRIGNYLGENNIKGAKRTVGVVVTMIACEVAVVCPLMYS